MQLVPELLELLEIALLEFTVVKALDTAGYGWGRL